MTEKEYLRQRIKDLIANCCDETLTDRHQANQKAALAFYLQQAKRQAPLNEIKSLGDRL